MMVQETAEPKGVVASSEAVEIKGPNRDRGKLMSFALKGDLVYRILTNTDTAEQAIVITAPGDVIRKMAYDIVKTVEAEDFARAKTREKDE